MGGDVVERVEVVHVGRQQRDLDRRAVRPFGQQRCQRARVRPRRADAARRGCVHSAASSARPRARRRAARRRASATVIVAEPGMDAVGDDGGDAEARARSAGRRTRPPPRPSRGAAEVTSTNLVASALSSAATVSARSRNPASMPAKAWKKAAASASASEPTTRPIARRIGWLASDSTRNPVPRRQHDQLEHRVVEEAGEHAGRLEEVERVPARRRVDDDEVEPLIGVQLVQRLRRHELLRAAEGVRHVAVEAVLHDPRRLLLARRVASAPHARTSPACRASSPTARRRQPVELDPLRLAGEPARKPERVGQPAGRVDRDDHDATARACRGEPDRGGDGGLADAARPAAHDARRRRRGRPSSRHARCQRDDVARLEVGGERSPATRCARLGRDVADACELGGLAQPGGCAGTRRPRRASSTCVRARPNDTPAGSGNGGPSSTWLTTTGPSRTPTRLRSTFDGLEQLVDRRRLGHRHQHDLAAGVVGEHRDHLVGLGAHRPAAHGVAQPGGRGEERDGVPGRRAVDDDQVPLARPLELLDLAEHDEVVDARRGRADHVDHAGAWRAAWRSSGSRARAGTPRARRRRRSSAPRGRARAPASAGLPSSSTTSTRRPRRQPRVRAQPIPWSSRRPLCRRRSRASCRTRS